MHTKTTVMLLIICAWSDSKITVQLFLYENNSERWSSQTKLTNNLSHGTRTKTTEVIKRHLKLTNQTPQTEQS